MLLTKGDNEMTIAPSLRSKNLGRKASFTVVNWLEFMEDECATK